MLGKFLPEQRKDFYLAVGCYRGLYWLADTHFNDEEGPRTCGFTADIFSFTSYHVNT